MRPIDPTLKTRILQAQQTLYNNADPRTEILALRPTTAIQREQFWQKSIVAPGVSAHCTSVAIRRQGAKADRAYVAYVAGGTLTVKSAAIVIPSSRMVWTTETIIPNCIACALEFEGHFRHGGYNVEFKTDAKPHLAFVDSVGTLRFGILGESYELLASTNVTAVDIINGVSNSYDAQDQGFFVFYIANGTVYYNTFADGVWEGQRTVPLAPANAVSLKAERTFDWRIVLHVQDSAGALYEIFTKMEATGWNGTEFIDLSVSAIAERIPIAFLDFADSENISLAVAAISARLYALSPVMLTAHNVAYTLSPDIEDDYGYQVVLEWDEMIFSVAGNEISFLMTDEIDAVFGCTAIEQVDSRTLRLTFQNFNNAVGECTISYTPGTMTGEIEPVAADNVSFTPTGLVPFAVDPPVPVSAENLIDWEV